MGRYAYPLRGKLPKNQHAKYYRDTSTLYSVNNRIIIGWPGQGAHTESNGGWKSINGVDFAGTPNSTAIIAVTSGRIKNYKYSNYDKGKSNGSGIPKGAGWQFEIHGDDGSVWFYTHTWGLGRKGSRRVNKGDVISSMFPYWYRTPHLHISKAGGGTARSLFLHKIHGQWRMK